MAAEEWVKLLNVAKGWYSRWVLQSSDSVQFVSRTEKWMKVALSSYTKAYSQLNWEENRDFACLINSA